MRCCDGIEGIWKTNHPIAWGCTVRTTKANLGRWFTIYTCRPQRAPCSRAGNAARSEEMAGSDPSHREDSRRKRGIDGVAPPSARCRETGAEVDVVDLAASPCDSFLKAEAGCSDRGRRHRETSKTRRSGGDEPSCSPGGRGDGDGDGRVSLAARDGRHVAWGPPPECHVYTCVGLF